MARLTEEEEIELLLLLEQQERERVSPKLEAFRDPIIGGDCPKEIRIRGCRGGRGAGAKSHSLVSLIVQRANIQRIRVGCFREIQESLDESVYALIKLKVEQLGYSGWIFQVGTIISPAGSKFIFKGLKDLRASRNVKGLEAFDIFFIEEAATISMDSWDLLMPTLMRNPGSQLWFAYNPESEFDPVTVKIWNRNRSDALLIELQPGPIDNPWWNDGLQKEMEEDYKADPDEAEHIWGGQPRKQGQRSVMSRVSIRAAMERVIEPVGIVQIGCDVARYGDDRTTIYKRKGLVVVDRKAFSKQDTMTTAYECWAMADHDPSIPIYVDDSGVGCVTKGTRVLTLDGWRLVEDIKVGDRIYSLDENRKIIVEKVRENIKREPTRIIKSGEFEFSFSHIIPYKTRAEHPFHLESWENILDRKYIILDDNFPYEAKKNDFEMPEHSIEMPYGGKKVIHDKMVIPANVFARFLGWFISDGHLDRTSMSIGVTQKKKKNIQDIYNLLSYLGKPIIKRDGVYVCNKSFFDWIDKNCYRGGKGFRYLTVPRWVSNNSKDVINAFLDGFVAGDGFVKNGTRYYITSGKWLVDDLIELLHKAGYSCNAYIKSKAGSHGMIEGRVLTRTVDNYCVFEYRSKTNVCINTSKKEERFDNVYELCITGKTKLYYTMCPDSHKPVWTHNGGVTDRLRELGAKVYPINFGGSPADKDKYTSIADELWFNFPIDEASIPDDPVLMAELAGRQYAYDHQGRRKIESKDDYKKRCGRSPDEADALLLCYYDGTGIIFPDEIREQMARRRRW